MKKILSLALFLSVLVSKAQPPGCSSGIAANGLPGQAGLLGEYFAGYFNDNPAFFPSAVSTTNRVESNLNYSVNNWGAIVPPATGTVADPNQFSARYRGSIYIAAAGTYTFYLTSDDASFMWIDNDALTYPAVTLNALISNGGYHGDVTVSNSVYLTPGLHNIQIQYGESSGGNHLIFEYQNTALGIGRQAVPNSILCTSVQPLIIVPPPAGCVCTDPSANPAAAGLYAQYYAGYYNDVQSFFTTGVPGLTRIDPTINFATDNGWGNIVPPAGGSLANPDVYSTRWTGSIYIGTTATYTFYLTSDDASYLWFDTPASAATPTVASATINNGGLHSPATVTWTGTLTAGFHRLKMHFGENYGNNRCVLEYSSAAISRQVVPQSVLCTCYPSTVLPVELLGFEAKEVKGEVYVSWTTASETRNDRFIVDRSADGIHWTRLAEQPGAGNSNIQHTYQVVDTDPQEGINYYRLRQVDFDGTVTDAGIEAVRVSLLNMDIEIYPNPVNGNFILKSSVAISESPFTLTVTDLAGKQVPVQVTPTGDREIGVRLPSMPDGIYFVRFTSAGSTVSKRIICKGN